jgi:hypothetical protein
MNGRETLECVKQLGHINEAWEMLGKIKTRPEGRVGALFILDRIRTRRGKGQKSEETGPRSGLLTSHGQ